MNKKHFALLMATILPLSACGNTQMDRALSGAGIGAGAGALASVAIGGSVGTAVIVGAGVGAVAGAITDNNKINFGKPLWR